MSVRRFIIIFALALGLSSAASAATAAPLAERTVLDSGMVLLHAEKTTLPFVTVIVSVGAGSVSEPAEKAGLANLTADLLNEGTATRTAKQISEAIEFVGGSLDTSGGADYVSASLTVLKKDLDLGFELLADILLNPAFDDKEIERRKRIIKNAIIQQKEEPGAIASKAFNRAVFGDHPYGRPTEGTEESLDRITRQDIVDYHAARYAPNNAAMVVVGDIDHSRLNGLLEKYFGNWKKKEIGQAALPAVGPKQKAEVLTTTKDLQQSTVVLGHIGISRDNPDFYAVSVMNYILGGGGFASRLMDNIRDNRGLAYDVRSSFSASRFGGSFTASLQTKNESANTAIEEVLKEMERIRTEPVTEKELADAQAYLTGSFPLRLDSNRKIAGMLAAIENYQLGLDYVEQYPKRIRAVTREDILRVARTYLDPKNYVLVVVGDIGKAALKYK